MTRFERAAARVGPRRVRAVALVGVVVGFVAIMTPAFVELDGFWANALVRIPGHLLLGLSVGILVGGSRWMTRRQRRGPASRPGAAESPPPSDPS